MVEAQSFTGNEDFTHICSFSCLVLPSAIAFVAQSIDSGFELKDC